MEKKIALVTGATSGIGEACARKLAENNYNVIITGRKADRLETVAAELKNLGAEVLTLAFDVRDREAATDAVKGLPAEWQEIDVLINNAGGALGLEPEYAGSYEDWDTMIDTNIKGLLTMTRLIVPGMVERNRGHVVNIGSVAGDAAYGGGIPWMAITSGCMGISGLMSVEYSSNTCPPRETQTAISHTFPPPSGESPVVSVSKQANFTSFKSIVSLSNKCASAPTIPPHLPTQRLRKTWPRPHPSIVFYAHTGRCPTK